MRLKRALALLLALAGLLAFSGCGSIRMDELYEEFDEETVIATAQEMADYIIAKDFESATAMVREDLQELLSPEIIEDAYDQMLTDVGAFEEYTEALTASTSDEETGDKFAAVRLKARFEEKSIFFTVYMNTGYEVTALYME